MIIKFVACTVQKKQYIRAGAATPPLKHSFLEVSFD